MTRTIEILTDIHREKIPSWKVDIVQNLVVVTHIEPRKTYISGHFHLKTPINSENRLSKSLIF